MSDAFLISLIHLFKDKLTTIRLIDEDTDVDAIIDVIGPSVGHDIVVGIKKAVDKYKSETPYYWDDAGCCGAVCTYLTEKGYEVVFRTPDIKVVL